MGLALCPLTRWALLHAIPASTPSRWILHLPAANVTVEAKRRRPANSLETRSTANNFKHLRLFTAPLCEMLGEFRQKLVLDGVPPGFLLPLQVYGEGMSTQLTRPFRPPVRNFSPRIAQVRIPARQKEWKEYTPRARIPDC